MATPTPVEQYAVHSLEARAAKGIEVRGFAGLALLMKNLRKARKLTQADLAESLNTRASCVARLEACGGSKKHSPSLNTIEAVFDKLGYDISFNITLKEQNHGQSTHQTI